MAKIAGFGSASGSTPKCHGSGTLLRNKKIKIFYGLGWKIVILYFFALSPTSLKLNFTDKNKNITLPPINFF
jgi:hypothetical protein